MKTLNFCFLLIQLVIFAVLEVNSNEIFFRGRLFDDDSENLDLRMGTDVEEKWHLQKLNHCNSTDTRTWLQRYYVNKKYYKESNYNPIFLLLGGEYTLKTSSMTTGFWVERAQEYNALLLQLEHRFYGKSHPTKDTSVANLQYLTVEQALEDTVHFIQSIKKTYKLQETNKWILFGGSYAGNLVAWLRLKYPHLIHGVVSSSSPVLSVVDYKDYFRVVAESLATYSNSCVAKITEAFSSINQLSQNAQGKQSLSKKLNLCSPLEKSKDFKNDFAELNSVLATKIAGVVQYSKVSHSNNKTIDNICKILENKDFGCTSLDRFGALTKTLLASQKKKCLVYNYRNFVNYFSATSWNDSANSGTRQWFYQSCNQVDYFQTSSSEPHVFGKKFPVEHLIKQCRDVFGPQYTAKFIEEQIKHINNVYGGKDIINNVDRVVFVHGSIDPWNALRATYSFNAKSPILYIIGTAHCADMKENNKQDLPQLTAARAAISSYIHSWLL